MFPTFRRKKASASTPASSSQQQHNNTDGPLYLAAALDAPTAIARVGADWPTKLTCKVGDKDTDVPVTYLDKDAIEEGEYVHPITNKKFTVTKERIGHWVRQFNAMQSAGLEIPTPIDHDKSQMAREKKPSVPFASGGNNIGYVMAARQIDGPDGKARLRLTHQVIGEDAVSKAMRNRVSINVEPEFKDEKGRTWKDVIVHSAYTPIPVVSGMGSFAAFAAARQGEGVEEYQPARDMETVMAGKDGNGSGILTPERRNQIGQVMLEAGEADISSIAEMADQDMLDWFLEYAFSENNDGEDDVTDIGAGASSAVAGALAASRQQQQDDEEDPAVTELMLDRADNYRGRIDLMVERGEITPAQGTTLRGRLMLGKEPNTLLLSRDPSDNKCQIERDLELLRAGAPTKRSASRTSLQQTTALSRSIPDGTDDEELKKQLEADKEWAKSQNKRKS